MKAVKFAEDVHPITELALRASEIVDHALHTQRPVLLTRSGQGVAVLLDVEQFEALNERVNFMDAVEVGVQAARAGDLHPNEEAMRILDTFGEQGD